MGSYCCIAVEYYYFRHLQPPLRMTRKLHCWQMGCPLRPHYYYYAHSDCLLRYLRVGAVVVSGLEVGAGKRSESGEDGVGDASAGAVEGDPMAAPYANILVL